MQVAAPQVEQVEAVGGDAVLVAGREAPPERRADRVSGLVEQAAEHLGADDRQRLVGLVALGDARGTVPGRGVVGAEFGELVEVQRLGGRAVQVRGRLGPGRSPPERAH